MGKDPWEEGEEFPTLEQQHADAQQIRVTRLFAYAVMGCEVENYRDRLSRNFLVQRRILVCMGLSSAWLPHI